MKYSYTSKDSKGQIQKGIMEAANEVAAAKLLHSQKLYVLSLKQEGRVASPASPTTKSSIFSPRVSLKDKIIFTQQLAMMIKSGLPLVDAFVALQEQTENKYFAKVIDEVIKDVKGGKNLSGTLAKYPQIFSKFYISIVSAGEKSGKLDEVLGRLSEELQKDYSLITKIKAAVTYPILIIVALVGIVILMLLFVVPEIKKIFLDMGVELPLITRIVLGTSEVLRNYWYIFAILIIGSAFGIHFGAKTETGGLLWDTFKLKIPLIGRLVQKIYMARFCRSTGTLVASGLPILNIIGTTQEVMNNRVYRNSLKKIGGEIESGVTLSAALKKEGVFPPMIYHLVSVGEKSGKLDYVLLSMANFFDQEVETSTNSLANLIEPILIIIVGAGVGLVVASVIMPIYSLVDVI